MIYTKGENFIEIEDKSQFNTEHILECGQVFCYEKKNNKYVVFPEDKYAEIIEENGKTRIYTEDVDYFINWFDLDNDYNKIKSELAQHTIMHEPIKFGYGIRILKQNPFETLISFIISANNNIKRIKLILNNIRNAIGENVGSGDYKSFPSFDRLLECSQEFFKTMGAGYRADYLYKVIRQITPSELYDMQSLSTKDLRAKLILLSGVGPKVADCVLLFGFNRFDVFPVDTWIVQMYNKFYTPLQNREKISQNLVNEFGYLAGYAQQYLFYYQRSFVGRE